MKMVRKIAALALGVCLLCGMAACAPKETGKTEPEPFEYNAEAFKVDKNNLYGIGSPVRTDVQLGVPLEKQAGLFRALGATSHRSWMLITELMSPPSATDAGFTVNKTIANIYHSIFTQLKFSGVKQIVGMSHTWFLPASVENPTGDVQAMPERDTSAGSDYMKALELYEKSWYTLVKEFPEITYWELGNEMNHDPFLHKIGYLSDSSKVFSFDEKVEISSDMMYYASRGVYRANPDAITIMPAAAPVGGMQAKAMLNYVKGVYEKIKSGEFPAGEEKSTDSDAYFLSLAWHPYIYADAENNDEWITKTWVELNDEIFEVAKENGDGDKKVFFTEFGLSDMGDKARDERQGRVYELAFDKMKNDMPYLEACHVFRLFEDAAAAQWGGDVERYYGLFEEAPSFRPKEKAKAIQKIFGGTDALDKYVIKFGDFASGENLAPYAQLTASSSSEHVDWDPGWGLKFIADGAYYEKGGPSVSGWSNWYEPGYVFGEPYNQTVGGTGGGAPAVDYAEWILFTFGEIVEIDRIAVYAPAGDKAPPQEISVLGSADGEEWTTLVGRTRLPFDGKEVFRTEYTFDAAAVKYVRVRFPLLCEKKEAFGYMAQLSEIQIFKA